MKHEGKLDPAKCRFLLQGAPKPHWETNQLEWLTNQQWDNVGYIGELEGLEKLTLDIQSGMKRWREWVELEAPERERLPGEWRSLCAFDRLLVIRALRPERIMHAVAAFVATSMGQQYVEPIPFDLRAVMKRSCPRVPLLFILFPGADPINEVEGLGNEMGYTREQGRFHAVAMGQLQENVASRSLAEAAEHGGWVMLQNIHLMTKWLPQLDAMIEILSTRPLQGLTKKVGIHPDFRLFLSAESTLDPRQRVPVAIIRRSIKLIDEPPQTLRASMLRAISAYRDGLETSSRPADFKRIFFTLCFFHSVVIGRKRFGAQGWAATYSFTTGDLLISADVLWNYLEVTNADNAIPWEDIRYILGEIMYGGHITD
uniref:Dynein heavy chain n=1 Tax=Eutreptiella gymnastica TaxID=73025 RepID=A0A7S1HZX9_9EUGL